MTVTTRDNGWVETPDWQITFQKFCSKLFGDDRCECVSCRIEELAMPALDGRGDN
jgi:hypothetical protein